MTPQKNRSLLHISALIPVVLIVIAACGVSIAAVFENMRFVKSTGQVLAIVAEVRSVIVEQKTFAQTPGEDIWADLERMGRIQAGASHTNPWGGDVRAVSVGGVAVRIEDDLPVQNCRRMAGYFLQQSPELGLLAMEAQDPSATVWSPIYPAPDDSHGHASETACGNGPNARLAVVFRAR